MSCIGIVVAAAIAGSSVSSQCVTHFDLAASPGDALSMSLALPLSGTFIGNYDAANNPTGTQTRPNLSGGSGNNPIAYSATVKPSASVEFPQGVPVVSFCVTDDGLGGAIVDCGWLDLIQGDPSPLTINITISYPNFHTVSPTAIYFGVSNVTLPLPAGEISAAHAVQTAPAAGLLVPGRGGSLILTASLPMELVFEATVLGQVIAGDPTPIMLPIVAELQPTLQGDYVAVASVQIPETQLTVPIAGQVVENQPIDLPTIIPPGNSAHLLVSGTFSDGTLTFALSANLSGPGETNSSPADFNEDCVVDGDDLGTLLGQWGACRGCAADFNDDGVVDGDDLGTLLGEWG